MKNLTTTLAFASLSIVSFQAAHAEDEPLFDVGAFIAGMQAEGRFGTSDAPLEGSWSFPEDQETAAYVYDIADTPMEFEQDGVGPGGATNHGRTACIAEVDETTVTIGMMAENSVDTAGQVMPYMTWAQVSGEFHININAPAELNYEFCAYTENVSAYSVLRVKKLVNGTFGGAPLAEQNVPSNAGSICSSGTLTLDPGYYQFYFANWSNVTSQNGFPGSKSAMVVTMGELEITPLVVPNPADITGDGKVDGQDLARLLGAWGSSAGGGDLNGDGTVDGQDLAILLGAWTG